MNNQPSYLIKGSYYEACNCEAVCPCRKQNGVPGGLSTYGICDFLLSWKIISGHYNDESLNDTSVCIAGTYNDDEDGSPWSVIIYIDEDVTDHQFDALAEIFKGNSGGNILFTQNFATVLEVKRARIELRHDAGSETIKIGNIAAANVSSIADFAGTVSCSIPGHDHPGVENISSLSVRDNKLDWNYQERCGFATDFAYFS